MVNECGSCVMSRCVFVECQTPPRPDLGRAPDDVSDSSGVSVGVARVHSGMALRVRSVVTDDGGVNQSTDNSSGDDQDPNCRAGLATRRSVRPNRPVRSESWSRGPFSKKKNCLFCWPEFVTTPPPPLALGPPDVSPACRASILETGTHNRVSING